MSKKNRIRLMAGTPLACGGIYEPTEAQTHYLLNVMRLNSGDSVFLFDGQNGEFEAKIVQKTRKNIILSVHDKVSDVKKVPDVWLLFAPLKKDNTDIVVQKAVELGVSKILPVKTEYTFSCNIRQERLKAQIIEALEQSRRTDLAEILPLNTLTKVLQNWDEKRTLVYLDETGSGKAFRDVFAQMKEPVAFLIGPEGGFSKKELEILKELPYTLSVSLGDRILRAETACIAGLSCWQALCGDWK